MRIKNKNANRYSQVGVLSLSFVQYNFAIHKTTDVAPKHLSAAKSQAEIERIVQRTNSRLNRGGQRVDLAYVLDRVRETREQGFAFSKGAVAEGVGVIGIALPPSDSEERIAIGVGGLISQLERSTDTFVQVIRDSIAEYTRRPDASSAPA